MHRPRPLKFFLFFHSFTLSFSLSPLLNQLSVSATHTYYSHRNTIASTTSSPLCTLSHPDNISFPLRLTSLPAITSLSTLLFFASCPLPPSLFVQSQTQPNGPTLTLPSPLLPSSRLLAPPLRPTDHRHLFSGCCGHHLDTPFLFQ